MNEHFPPNDGEENDFFDVATYPDDHDTPEEPAVTAAPYNPSSSSPEETDEGISGTDEVSVSYETISEKPAEDEPTESEPAEDEPTENEPAEDEPAEDEPAEDEPAEDEPAEDEPTENEPAEDEPAEDEPAEDEPAEDEPAEERDETQGQAGERTISADLIRGHINTIILRSLYDGDKYGYAIIAEIERKSHKQYQLKQPSLYSALKRLEREGYVTSYWGGSVSGGRRKYFSLTDAGKEIAERNQSEWEYSRTVIDSLISDRDFDFNQSPPSPVDMRVLKQSTSRVPGREEPKEEYFDLEDDMHADSPAPQYFRAPFSFEEEPEEEENAAATAAEDSVLESAETLPDNREQELADRRAALEEEFAKIEEAQARREEELRAKEEALRNEEAQRLRREEELLQREHALQEEEERRKRILAEETEKAETERLRAEYRAREEARIAEEMRIRREAEEIARARYEQQLREYEEHRRAEEEARRAEEEARRAEEQARLEEETRRAEEEAKRKEEARLEEERLKHNEERAHAMALNAEKEQQNARILEMEPFIEERARYEKMLRDQEERFRSLHERELAEQEQRIREEDEVLFRQREQQMIHQNYLNLVNTPPAEERPSQNEYTYYSPSARTESNATAAQTGNPERNREYRSVIRKLYSNTLKQEPAAGKKEKTPLPQSAVRTAAPVSQPVSPAPAKKAVAPVAAKALDGVDFYDLETRAAQDGIRITTSGGRSKTTNNTLSVNLVHKGRALFLSAIVVFLICIAEGSLTLGFLNRLGLPRFYPYFIWGTGLALLLVTGLAYLNHYGERALRQTGNLLVNAIVTYALCVIVILIVALAAQIDFSKAGDLATYVVIPIVYFFNLLVFCICYYLQIRPQKD